MEQTSTRNPRRHIPLRFSLLTVVLLTTIAALGLVVWMQWRDVGPLRQEVRRLRGEVGILTVDDPTRIYATQTEVLEDDTWRWRLFLPRGTKYVLHTYTGTLPTPNAADPSAWFAAVRKNGVGSSETGSSLTGEFLLNLWVRKTGDKWMLDHKISVENGSTGGRISIYQPSGNWLSDSRLRWETSDLKPGAQSVYDSDEAVLLLLLRRPKLNTLPGNGFHTTAPQGPSDGIAVWIEPVD